MTFTILLALKYDESQTLCHATLLKINQLLIILNTQKQQISDTLNFLLGLGGI